MRLDFFRCISIVSICYLARASIAWCERRVIFFACLAFLMGAFIALDTLPSHSIEHLLGKIFYVTGLGLIYIAGFLFFRYLAKKEQSP